MKRYRLIALLILLFAIPSYAAEIVPERSANTVPIMKSQVILANGTSTFVVDLQAQQFYPILEGDFSLQFSGVTCRYATLTGATINAAYRVTHHTPSGVSLENSTGQFITGLLSGISRITSRLESVDIVTDLAHDSGDTEYCYSFWPEKCRYMIADVTAGATDVVTDVYLNMD